MGRVIFSVVSYIERPNNSVRFVTKAQQIVARSSHLAGALNISVEETNNAKQELTEIATLTIVGQ